MVNTLAAWLHNLDPYALKLWEGGPIRWYALAYIGGFVAAFLLIRRIARVGVSPVRPDRVFDLVVTAAIGVMLGGRLGFVLFYQPRLFVSFSDDLPFWDLLAINKGGMASHGGMLGMLVAMAWHGRRHHLPWLHLMDLTSFTMPVGIFLGRLANFVNGELLGRPCPRDFALAVNFPHEVGDLWTPEQQRDLAYRLGDLLPANVNLGAWVVEQVRAGNEAVIRIVEPLLTPRHPSQLYEAALEGLLMMLILLPLYARPRKPGLVFGVFATFYCLVRIVGEQFRLPDAHIENQEFAQWGITRGQLLSAVFLLVGLIIIALSLTRKAPPLGGWLRVRSEEPGAKREERR